MKTQEWSTPYNPFNSMKNLVHADHFETILDAEEEQRDIKPPIVVNFDLTNICNYDCRFCMFANRDRADQHGKEFREGKESLPKGYAPTLPEMWKDWGVKAVCLGGGGDPTCHPDMYPMLRAIKEQELDLGMPSNGYLIDDQEKWDTIADTCKWIGFSIDAGNATDYAVTKGVPKGYFRTVLNNLEGIATSKAEKGSKVNVGYKYLIDDFNYTSIYEGIQLASVIGCNTVQVRPAINHNQVELFAEHEDEIWEQVSRGRELERDDFKVMGITHKFQPNYDKKHNFDKCRASMLTSTWCADGEVYLCTDTRGDPWAHMTSHYPDPKKVLDYWGSKDHWDVVNGIDFGNDCDRCTLTAQNEYFENVFIDDKMERNLI